MPEPYGCGVGDDYALAKPIKQINMNKTELRKLDLAISEAKKYALEQIEGVLDNGSCNFDHIVIKVGRTMQANIDEMMNRGWKDYRCKNWLHISTPNVGQANRNTKCAEAMMKYLETLGYEGYIHYQLD